VAASARKPPAVLNLATSKTSSAEAVYVSSRREAAPASFARPVAVRND